MNGTEITDNNAYKGYNYKYSTVSGSNGNYIWTFEEDGNWSWKYEPLAPVTKTITTVEDIEEPIVFENKLKKYFDGGEEDTGSTKVHDETSKESRMIQ